MQDFHSQIAQTDTEVRQDRPEFLPFGSVKELRVENPSATVFEVFLRIQGK